MKNGLIDIDKVYEIVIEKEADESDTFLRPIGVTRQEKWKKVMAYMSKNP